MTLTEPTALAIVRARDRALDALRELTDLAFRVGFEIAADPVREVWSAANCLPICRDADRVVAEMVTDEKCVNGGD